jgi:hypothetical protein
VRNAGKCWGTPRFHAHSVTLLALIAVFGFAPRWLPGRGAMADVEVTGGRLAPGLAGIPVL